MMCRSPKSSATSRRSVKIKAMSREQYEDYARMVRHASSCYEKAQQRKAARCAQIAAQQQLSSDDAGHASPNGKQKQFNVWSAISAFFTTPIALP
jgi:hypothetical protein